jgi:hypothetical protein
VHSDTACDWHCVPGDDTELIQPSRSLTNAISAFATAPVGKKRRSHVAPRSLERNSALCPMSAHTTLLDGALSCAGAGRTIGVPLGATGPLALGDALAVGVAVAEGVTLAVGVGVGVGDVATAD